MRLDIRQLQAALHEGVPPSRRHVPDGCRLAAVMAILVERDEPHLLLIRRADRGDPWSNHIAMPGGHIDADDADSLAAAYRETQEEVGLSPESIEFIGDLGLFRTQLHNLAVHVFLGLWNGGQTPKANEREVAKVFEVPLSELAKWHRAAGYHNHAFTDLGEALTYPIEHGTVWGLTARIIHVILELLADLGE